MRDTTEDRIREIMADILGLDPRRIDEGTSMDNTESWDSANHISLVLAIEEAFGVTFDVSEMEAMLSFADILQAVNARV
jgi:acyl carrier protein